MFQFAIFYTILEEARFRERFSRLVHACFSEELLAVAAFQFHLDKTYKTVMETPFHSFFLIPKQSFLFFLMAALICVVLLRSHTMWHLEQGRRLPVRQSWNTPLVFGCYLSLVFKAVFSNDFPFETTKGCLPKEASGSVLLLAVRRGSVLTSLGSRPASRWNQLKQFCSFVFSFLIQRVEHFCVSLWGRLNVLQSRTSTYDI